MGAEDSFRTGKVAEDTGAERKTPNRLSSRGARSAPWRSSWIASSSRRARLLAMTNQDTTPETWPPMEINPSPRAFDSAHGCGHLHGARRTEFPPCARDQGTVLQLRNCTW